MMNETESMNAEKAILVGLKIADPGPDQMSLEQSLEELELLASSADVEVLSILTQALPAPNSRTYIGSGKVEELKMLASELGADMVIFDDELSPRHQRELEELLGNKIKVIDRTALILDIFARHADTREGQLQVELAQLEYRLPRLTRAWTHLARQAGGGGGRTGSGGVGLRGPGEQQLELDRRDIRRRIRNLNDLIEKIREHRSHHRDQRRKTQVPVVALVGYTNAGKSTLLNRIAGSEIYTADQLFATLDPTTRQIELKDGQLVLLTDTVGFIQKLPTQLVVAFRATLEEIKEANLLLHVVDASSDACQLQKLTVLETLKEIEADQIPVLTVYNKIDLLSPDALKELKQVAGPASAMISARTGEGIEDLMTLLSEQLMKDQILLKVRIPFEKGQLLSIFHEKGKPLEINATESGTEVLGYLPKQLLSSFEAYRIN